PGAGPLSPEPVGRITPTTLPANARTRARRSDPVWCKAAFHATDAPARQSGPSSPAAQYRPARASPAGGGSAPNLLASQPIPSSLDQLLDVSPASVERSS